MNEKPKVFQSLIIKHLTLKGKQSLSEKILDKTIKQMQKMSLKNHKSLFKLLILKTTPIVKIKQIKKYRKKKMFEFPYIFKKSSRYTHSVKNLIKSSTLKTRNKKVYLKLTRELLASVKSSNDKVLNAHEYAFNIKKFANFRWFK